MGILSKCVSGAAENVKISNLSFLFIDYVNFYCITVQIMLFPILDFGLDQYGSEPFNFMVKGYNKLYLNTWHKYSCVDFTLNSRSSSV